MRQVGECVLLFLGFAVIPWLPRRVLVWLAHGLGFLAARLSRRERTVALANLERVLGDELDAAAREATVVEAFQSFALALLDVFWFAVFTRRRLRKYVELDASVQGFLRAAPLILIAPHMGNWETMALAFTLNGLPVVTVASPLANPVVDWILNRTRERTGMLVAERKGAIRTLLRTLSKGGRVAFLMDQNTLPEEGGVFVEFFGLPVPVSNAAGVLAARRNTPIVLVSCIADGRGFYTLKTEPPLAPSDDAQALTQAFTRVTEEMIRRQPGTWLWMYKRWKFVPPGISLDKYPPYAKEWRPQSKTESTATQGRSNT